MNYKIVALLIFVATSKIVLAQSTFKVTNQKTGEVIEGVAAQVSTPSGKTKIFISNKNGLINISTNLPYHIVLSHINYHDYSQEIKKSTSLTFALIPKKIILDDIVITGQYEPQSARNSVYTVRTINAETIANMGAIQLNDVLSRQLNIRIGVDNAIGNSTMSLQGIQGRNVKILIDGVPLINRNGNGNDADLGQINMSNIERIEIVEGPMVVSYGANAMAGVVNLITKKTEKNSFRVGVDLQGETIDNTYGLNNGISNFNITSGISLPKSFLLSVNGGVTRFAGFKGDKEGRELQWNPKDQHFYDASLIYKKDNFNISYKFEDFKERIDDLGITEQEQHHATGAIRYFGVDREYKSTRIIHQVQSDVTLSDFNRANLVLSYSDFIRSKRTFKNYLDNAEEQDFTAANSSDTTSYHVFLARGTFQNTNPNKLINYQAGFEINLESTSGGRIKNNEIQSMQDYAVFASVELKAFEKLKIRPGVRLFHNSTFNSNLVPSLNLKYLANKQLSFGAAYGRGYRAPNLRELYFEFIDSNHNIIGNENLTPEFSHHISANATHKWSKKTIGLKSNINFFYNDITDLIGFAFDPDDPTFATFVNIDNLKTVGVNVNETFMWGHLTLALGVGVIGRMEQPNEIEIPQDFLFSPETSIDLSYLEKFSKINFSLFYKYNGAASQYQMNADGDLLIATIDGFSLLDFTLNRELFKHTSLTLGAKNIFDIRNVNNTSTTSGGAHAGPAGATVIGFGRTYFLKLSFNLNTIN